MLCTVALTTALGIFYCAQNGFIGREPVVTDHIRSIRRESLEPPSSAIASLEEATRLLDKPWRRRRLNEAEKLFLHAATADLPLAYYGIACVIYQRHDRGSERHVADDMAYAANRKVVAAKAAMVNYYANGYGVERDLRAAYLALLDLLNLVDGTSLIVGIPFPEQDISRSRILLNLDKCAPHVTDVTEIIEAGKPAPPTITY